MGFVIDARVLLRLEKTCSSVHLGFPRALKVQISFCFLVVGETTSFTSGIRRLLSKRKLYQCMRYVTNVRLINMRDMKHCQCAMIIV